MATATLEELPRPEADFPPEAGSYRSAVFTEEIVKDRLARSEAQIIDLIDEKMHQVLEPLVRASSAEGLVRSRPAAFRKYWNLLYATRHVIDSEISDSAEMDVIVQATMEAVQSQFEKKGAGQIGLEATEETRFCMATMQRAYRLLPMIREHEVTSPDLRERDRELALAFNRHIAWAHLHWHCLILAGNNEIRIRPDALKVLLDGLRASLNAYATAREGLRLRGLPKSDPPESTEWDDEDQGLASESTEDAGASDICEPNA